MSGAEPHLRVGWTLAHVVAWHWAAVVTLEASALGTLTALSFVVLGQQVLSVIISGVWEERLGCRS